MMRMEGGSMADIIIAKARPAHAGRKFANSYVALETAMPCSRISLRAAPDIAPKLAKPLGLKLPGLPKISVTKKDRTALWLGPDEWMVVDDDANAAAELIAALDGYDCSCVDISHRNMAVLGSGPGIESLLSAGCPQDLSIKSFPTGACSRTLFGKVEIVLWRYEEDAFRIEVWRSFSDYLWAYFLDAAKDTGN